MKKQYAIISHNRHRDDYVYIVTCKEEELESYLEKIWTNDFHYSDATIKNNGYYGDSSGDYQVEVAIIKTIKPPVQE